MNILKAVGLGVALALVASCRSETPAPANSNGDASMRAAVEERSALVFSNAALLKPRETALTNDLAFTLAPLLMQEIVDSNADANRGPAAVFYQPGAAQIAGIVRPQMTYLWPGGNDQNLGVRLTLDSGGLPVIWEVLEDRPGPRVMFVSRSLEEKAQAAFDAPAPGRRFVVEPELSVAPDVMVARVIEDGPVAMGPIVHQTSGREISSVICRCMPPQVRELAATTYYELKPLSAVTNVDLEILGRNPSAVENLRLPPAW